MYSTEQILIIMYLHNVVYDMKSADAQFTCKKIFLRFLPTAGISIKSCSLTIYYCYTKVTVVFINFSDVAELTMSS